MLSVYRILDGFSAGSFGLVIWAKCAMRKSSGSWHFLALFPPANMELLMLPEDLDYIQVVLIQS